MTSFDEREKAFEAKFQRDQELQFKVRARRNRLLGQWAAAKMGLSGAAVDAYSKQVVEADFEKPGEEDVVEKVLKDLSAKGVQVSAGDIRSQMERLLGDAKQQILSETK
jgi:hypothetical protein